MARKKTKKSTPPTTYDKQIKKMTVAKKKKFDEEYRKLVLSELLIALMQEDEISVRKLAREAGLSSTIIQGVRSGSKQNITLQNFLKILRALGCSLIVKKDGQSFPLESAQG